MLRFRKKKSFFKQINTIFVPLTEVRKVGVKQPQIISKSTNLFGDMTIYKASDFPTLSLLLLPGQSDVDL